MPYPFPAAYPAVSSRLLRALLGLVFLSFVLAGCAARETPPDAGLAPQGEERPSVARAIETEPEKAAESPDAAAPEAAVTALPPKPARAGVGECFKGATGGGKSTASGKKAKKSAGRCEPQSLPFARCRSGIDTCKLGDTGPITWFACEKRRGNTGEVPRKGSILILDANKRRNMPTGHVVYVEDVLQETPDTWKLILSHTNYDRRCSLEANVEGRYSKQAGSIDFLTGAWAAWGKGLKVSGFILD